MIEARQLERLRSLLNDDIPRSRFYATRVRDAGLSSPLRSLGEFSEKVPFTYKSELVEDQTRNPPYGTVISRSVHDYSRLCQTSGTTGQPMRWLDTSESWSRLVDAWEVVLEGAEITSTDRVLVAFSFGPFLGFWLGFEAAARLGCLTIPGGAMTSEARLKAIMANHVTVVCCTPTYALRLGEVAHDKDFDLAASKVRAVIVGGEPGGSIPATRSLLSARWPGATIFDHYGMTEVGPVTFQCTAAPEVVHAIESHYVCEVVDPASGEPVPMDGSVVGELVLTNLERRDSPVLRYRTGDLVRPARREPCACGREGLVFEGGILGRSDDMIVVRGVNLFPASVEQVVLSSDGVAEYQVEIRTVRGMTELRLSVEPRPGTEPEGLRSRLQKAFRDAHGLRVQVEAAAPGALPRFELKAKRWIRN